MSEANQKFSSKIPVWVYVFIGTLILYTFTLAPTVMWGDSANVPIMVKDLYLDPAADGHPLYIVLGRVFSWLPGSELAVKLNFMSAVFGALAVMLTYLIVEELTGESIPALMAAGALALSHAFWQYSVITKGYTLNCLFLSLLVWLLLKWKADTDKDRHLYWAVFVFGLAISHHLILLMTGPAGLYFIAVYGGKRWFKWKKLFIMAGLILLGSALYWVVLLKFLFFTPHAVAGKAADTAVATGKVMDTVTGREHKQYLFDFDLIQLAKNLATYAGYLFYQFPIWGFGLSLYGLFKLLKNNGRIGIFFCLLILFNSLLFMGGSSLVDNTNYTFFIQDYLVYSVFIGFGCYWLLKQIAVPEVRNRKALILLTLLLLTPAATYQITPMLINASGTRALKAGAVPFRNTYDYFLNPSKAGYRGPRQYASAVFANVEPNAILLADYTPGAVVEYFQKVDRERPDIRLVYLMDATAGQPDDDLKPYVDKHYGEAPIYLASLIKGPGRYNVENLEKKYSIQPKWPVYKVVKNNNRNAIDIGH